MPSSVHGVTTAILGSCGVGFAPCRASDREKLIKLMEGVEDIPGSALAEGLTWQWESFPEYMAALDAMPHTIDFGLQMTHDPLRMYVMGDGLCTMRTQLQPISRRCASCSPTPVRRPSSSQASPHGPRSTTARGRAGG